MTEDDKPTINVTSHNQSGGITAHTVNVGPSRYELTAEDAANLAAKLVGSGPVAFITVGRDKDQADGDRLIEMLREAGVEIGRRRRATMYIGQGEAPLHVIGGPTVVFQPSA